MSGSRPRLIFNLMTTRRTAAFQRLFFPPKIVISLLLVLFCKPHFVFLYLPAGRKVLQKQKGFCMLISETLVQKPGKSPAVPESWGREGEGEGRGGGGEGPSTEAAQVEPVGAGHRR